MRTIEQAVAQQVRDAKVSRAANDLTLALDDVELHTFCDVNAGRISRLMAAAYRKGLIDGEVA